MLGKYIATKLKMHSNVCYETAVHLCQLVTRFVVIKLITLVIIVQVQLLRDNETSLAVFSHEHGGLQHKIRAPCSPLFP